MFEFHRFQPCGRAWVDAQRAAGFAPKPLQLVVDHSRWLPLDELLSTRRRHDLAARGGAAAAAAASAGGAACEPFFHAMRAANGAAHTLFGSGEVADALRRCIASLAAAQRARGGLKAPAAYREAVPGGLLVTVRARCKRVRGGGGEPGLLPMASQQSVRARPLPKHGVPQPPHHRR